MPAELLAFVAAKVSDGLTDVRKDGFTATLFHVEAVLKFFDGFLERNGSSPSGTTLRI